ncbi:MAG: hypothetical protein WC812_04755 [Candidatus Pacearchaeota archaeon]|jgi:hypothetical protein
MTELEQKTETYEGSMKYYESRMEYFIGLFKNHQTKVLDENIDKVKKVIDDYKEKYVLDSEYNSTLVNFVESFILN